MKLGLSWWEWLALHWHLIHLCADFTSGWLLSFWSVDDNNKTAVLQQLGGQDMDFVPCRQFIWSLWWTKWHCDRFLSKHFCPPLTLSCSQCSILFYHCVQRDCSWCIDGVTTCMIYHSFKLKEILLLRDVWMQKILITDLYCNNVNIILIWQYTLVFYSILTLYVYTWQICTALLYMYLSIATPYPGAWGGVVVKVLRY